jgi:hypothetical protein
MGEQGGGRDRREGGKEEEGEVPSNVLDQLTTGLTIQIRYLHRIVLYRFP